MHTTMYRQRLWPVNSYCHVSVFGEIWQQLLHHHVSWPPLQTITHKYVVIPVFNSLLWTKIHSFPFSVQSCLRSWPFCPYPISWCIFSKPSKLFAVAHTEVFLCCWYMWVKEESFENRKIGILASTKWKGFTKLELFSLMSDQSKLIFSGNTLSANIATPAPSLLYLYTQRSIWTPVQEWDSINLCYNKGHRLGLSRTQLRSRGMIDVSLHSTSAWKEALSKQIACSQNILCVLNCWKKEKKNSYFLVTWNGVYTRL